MLMDVVYNARAKVEEYVPMVAKLPSLQAIYGGIGGDSKAKLIQPPGRVNGHSLPSGTYPRVKTL